MDGLVYVVQDPSLSTQISAAEARELTELALGALGRKEAAGFPRRRIYSERSPNRFLWHNSMTGWLPETRTLAVRLDVATVAKSTTGAMEFPGDFSGLLLLYDTDTCSLYGIVHDHLLSPMRVAATSAVATASLARPDSHILGVLGGGEQALAHIRALVDVLPIRAVRIYIRTDEKRQDLEQRVRRLADIEVHATGTAEQAVRGSDVVVACTNAATPVFDGSWIENGQHIVTIASPDRYMPRQEIDVTAALRADVVVVNSRAQIAEDQQQPLLGLIEAGQIELDRIHELPEVVAKKLDLRTSPESVTLYDNNVGMGIQFAALGRLLVEQAIASNMVTTLPAELFMTHRQAGEVFSP